MTSSIRSSSAPYDDLRAKERMRQEFGNVDELAFDDALKFAQAIVNSQDRATLVALSAGDFLVRVSQKRYVADRFLHFDVSRIDSRLNSALVGRDCAPINAFGSLLPTLPSCGFAWNLFLLESYVRRFSERFRLESSNSVDFLVPRRSLFKFGSGVLNDELRHDGVANESKRVQNWLSENGSHGATRSERDAQPAPELPASLSEPPSKAVNPSRNRASHTGGAATRVERVRSLIANAFPNGFLLGSEIELERLREKGKAHGVATIADLSLQELDAAARAAGVIYGKKVYALPDDFDAILERELRLAVEGGARLIWFSLLFERLAGKLPYWVDPGFLRKRLAEFPPTLPDQLCVVVPSENADFLFVAADPDANRDARVDQLVAEEIVRVWGDAKVASVEELTERLTLVPEENVKRALKLERFVPNDKESFARYDRVEFPDELVQNTRRLVDNAMGDQRDAYFLINKLPLGKMHVLNEELDDPALQRALFQKALADRYELHGRIISQKGVKLSNRKVLTCFCQDNPRLDLSKIADMVEELLGTRHIQTALIVAYKTMIRISKEIFVAERLVHFDVKHTDKEIDKILGNEDYLTLQSFMIFSSWPDCGYPWNRFLLESYTLRFSKSFKLVVIQHNSRNVGAVVRRSSKFGTLDEIIDDAVAHAVVKTRCVPQKGPVINWLKSNGYLSNSSYARIEDVLKYARRYREENR